MTDSKTRQGQNVETLTDLRPETETGTFLGVDHRHTDADSIRRAFGIPRFNREAFEYPEVVPNMLIHQWERSGGISSGGTDALIIGKPDAGKSTLAKYLSVRLMEINNEAIVWRASESRSEWVAFAPWARVCLPSSCDATARLMSKDPSVPAREVDLEDIAREVVYYDDIRHLNQELLKPGRFHVVYPDPQMTGANEIYEASPKKYAIEFSPNDPPKHWWVAWMLDRVENGPFFWTSLMFDEVGDVISQDASKDEFDTYDKVLLFRDCYVDARKYGLSAFEFGHSETDIHEKLRRKVRWRSTLNGMANPTRPSQVVGVETVPMNKDLTSRMPVGRGLFWTETRFDHTIRWKDIPNPTNEVLQVRLSPRRVGTAGNSAATEEVEL